MRFDSTPYYHVGEVFPWEKLIGEMHEEVRLMDQAGFTGLWLAEHHFAWDGWYRASPNPILLGADLVACSDHMRIGQCGVILPDWNPIRVAEDIALLDQLTKGRVDFGVARGLNSRASLQFVEGADRSDQVRNRALFSEVLDIILGLWTQDSFTYKGQFYSYPVPGWKETNPLVYDSRYHGEDGELIALGLTPKPYQKPHPPVYMMAESVASHEYSAMRGISAMCFSISLGRMKEAWTAYNNVASEAQGREVPFGEGLAVMRPTYVADTYEEAVNTVRDGANLLGSWIGANPHKARTAMTLEEELSAGDMDLEWFDFQLKHDLILVGSPESVSEQIERLQKELNCQHLALFLNFPGLPLEKVLNCLDLFGEKVMPRFQ